MSPLNRDLIFLIHQFLNEANYKETTIKLEKETHFFFNMEYFEGLVSDGQWDEAEGYLSGFTKHDDNEFSREIFFELRKQKYLEALYRDDSSKALDILKNDLKVVSSLDEVSFRQLALLLTSPNIREKEHLSQYRSNLVISLKTIIKNHPLLRDKLQFPIIENSRLKTLIKHSLKWQHKLCENPMEKPVIKSLFVDHNCEQPNIPPPTIPDPMMGLNLRVGGFPVNTNSLPLQHPAAAQLTASRAGWIDSHSHMPRQAFSGRPLGLNPPKMDDLTGISLKRVRTSDNPVMDYQAADFESLMNRAKLFEVPEKINNHPSVNTLTTGHLNQSHGPPNEFDAELPMTVAVNLTQGSTVKSMDFHPMKQTFLLVGTVTGEFSLWEVCSMERITSRNFNVWDSGVCSKTLRASLANDYGASVNKVMWSPDGSHFGVAYSKHILHLYTYHDGDDVRNHLEIDAHVGSVNDLAFANPENQLSVITCGDDNTVKVWNVASGARMLTFEGHNEPVYSICSYYKEGSQLILSTAVDGQVRLWLFGDINPRAQYGTSGRCHISLVYSTDGMRMFSCGTNYLDKSYLAEWNLFNGHTKKNYIGLADRSVGIVQFDTRNQLLAVADAYRIKFWDMNDINMLCSCNADGGLPDSPCIRFNKDGTLLAVSTNANGIKILANFKGLKVIQAREIRTGRISAASAVRTDGDARATKTGIGAVDKRSSEITLTEGIKDLPDAETPKNWKLTEITEPSQLRSLSFPDSLMTEKFQIMRLTYTNSGDGILALAKDGKHKIWKWPNYGGNTAMKATTSITPQIWDPSNGKPLSNAMGETNLDEVVPCFALSSNDSYLLSASGGKLCLYNMLTFRTMATFRAPPPTATSVAIHAKDNNIIAIGMNDSSIYIPDVQLNKVSAKLQGHEKRVTGLDFSSVLNVLVSSGADAQLCVWSIDKWEKKTSNFLQTPPHCNRASNTRIQFHRDQTQFLVVHESLLAIYEAQKLACKKKWVRGELSAPITDATFSCDNRSIYASFVDGCVLIFTAGLEMKCRINRSSYLPTNQSSDAIYPSAIAAHPTESNQFALGLTDGSVHVVEPLETERQWGTAPLVEDGDGQTEIDADINLSILRKVDRVI